MRAGLALLCREAARLAGGARIVVSWKCLLWGCTWSLGLEVTVAWMVLSPLSRRERWEWGVHV